jgi:hypothetical protein
MLCGRTVLLSLTLCVLLAFCAWLPFTVGARATVPIVNANVTKELGIVNVADQITTQQRLAYTAAIHLNMIGW